MNWNRLKSNLCPQCKSTKMLDFMSSGNLTCKCGFKISPDKMTEIVSNLNKPKKPFTRDINNDL